MQLKPRWSVALPRHFEVRKYHFSPSALQHAWRGGQAPDLKNSPTPRTAISSARRPVRWCLAAWQNWQRWSDAGSHTVVFQKVFYAVEIRLSQNNHGSKRDWLKGEECETALGSRCLTSPTRRHLDSPGWMVQLHNTQGWLRVWPPESLKAWKRIFPTRSDIKNIQKLCCIVRQSHALVRIMLSQNDIHLSMAHLFTPMLTLFLTPVGLGSVVHLVLALDALSHLLCKALGISLYCKHSKQPFAGLWYILRVTLEVESGSQSWIVKGKINEDTQLNVSYTLKTLKNGKRW